MLAARTSTHDLTPAQREQFTAFYRDEFDFVLRNLRRLGVPAAALDDALQDVYLVVLRRIAEFREGTHPRAWLFAILLRTASNHRRSQRRRGDSLSLPEDGLATRLPGPFELTAQDEARRVLYTFLEQLPERRRAVFVMAELEQMSAPEIAAALSANLNTVYSWLRTARSEFMHMVERCGVDNDEAGRG